VEREQNKLEKFVLHKEKSAMTKPFKKFRQKILHILGGVGKKNSIFRGVFNMCWKSWKKLMS